MKSKDGGYDLTIFGNFFLMDYGAQDEDIKREVANVVADMTTEFMRDTYHNCVKSLAMKRETEPGNDELNDTGGRYWDVLRSTHQALKNVTRESSLDSIFLKNFIESYSRVLYPSNFDFNALSKSQKYDLDNFFFGNAIKVGTNVSFFD